MPRLTLAQSILQHPDAVLLLLASFDGVLADYQTDPRRAHVPAGRLALLRRLQQLPDVVVAVISGRPLADLRARVPLEEGAYFVGLHGLEMVGPGFAFACHDAIEAYRGRMASVVARLQRVVGHVPGVRLEDKGPIVALHTHEAASEHVVWSRLQLLGAAADLVNSASVRALRGRDVLELLPNVGHSRAAAVRALEQDVAMRHDRPVFTAYLGADWPDDDAARVTGENNVAAVVGQGPDGGHRLHPSGQLDVFLRELILVRQRAARLDRTPSATLIPPRQPTTAGDRQRVPYRVRRATDRASTRQGRRRR